MGTYFYLKIMEMQSKQKKKDNKIKMEFKGKVAIGGPWSLIDVEDNQ